MGGDAPAKDAPTASTGSAGPAAGLSSIVSLVDVVELADLFKTLNKEVDDFVRRESEKLFDQESKNQQARKSFQEVHDLIKTFLDDFKPEGGHPPPDRDQDESDTDEDGAGGRKGLAALKWKIEDAPAPVGPEQRRLLSKRLMPQFTRYITEDKEAVQNAGEMLNVFIEKFFKSNKELAALKEKNDPINLLKGLFRVISLELG